MRTRLISCNYATTSGIFDISQIKYVDIDVHKDSYLWIKNGDILIQRSNSIEYVGVSAVYKGKNYKFIYPDLMMKIHPIENVLPDYLHAMLMSEDIRMYFRDNASGTSGSMPKIDQKIVMNARVPLVDIENKI